MLGRFYDELIHCDDEDSQLIGDLIDGIPHSNEGTGGHLAPRERVVRKTTYDAFFDTALEAFLRDNEVEQVLIVGVLTHLCCETTARSAFVRGFEVYVAADATATSSESLHLGSLMALADGFGVVMSTEEVLQVCETSRSS